MKLTYGIIQHNIPLPPKKFKERKYHFEEMQIGDSMLLSSQSRQSIYHFKQNHPEFHFVVRNEKGNIRVWRVNKPI